MPHKKLYGKDADLSYLNIIGERAFVYIEIPNKLGHTSWEGMVCGFSKTVSNSYLIWNPKRGAWWRAGNIIGPVDSARRGALVREVPPAEEPAESATKKRQCEEPPTEEARRVRHQSYNRGRLA